MATNKLLVSIFCKMYKLFIHKSRSGVFCTTLKSKKSCQGFTLIELLVVIFIIGILVALLLSNILGARQRAEDVQRKSEMQQLKKALRLYYNDNQRYPVQDNFPNPGEIFESSDGASVYMKQLPVDYSYTYHVSADGEEFRLVVELDNISDKEIQKSQDRCPKLSAMEDYADVDYVVCED